MMVGGGPRQRDALRQILIPYSDPDALERGHAVSTAKVEAVDYEIEPIAQALEPLGLRPPSFRDGALAMLPCAA